MKKVLLSIILFCCISSSIKAFEKDLRTIAKRPNSNELFVGGEFKTVFVLNAVSGETIRTFTVEGGAEDMVFNSDGSVLIIKASTNLLLVDPVKGSVTKNIDNRFGKFFLYERSKYVVFVDRYAKKVQLLSSKDGSLIKEFMTEFEPRFVAINKNEQQMVIFSSEMEIKDEASLITNTVKPASGYNVYNKAFINQQSDGKGVSFVRVDLNSMSVGKLKQIPYSPNDGSFSHSVSFYDGEIYIINFEILIKIDAKDKAFPVELENAGFCYASVVTKDERYIIQSATKEGFIYDCKEKKSISYNVKGESEFTYSTDIITDNDTVILLAKDYTIVLMNTSGSIIRKYKINKAGPNVNFGLFYSNGFNKPELRAKEAEIINKELKALGIPEIDLEKNIGNSNVLIASLDTQDKSQSLQKALKTAGLKYITKIAPVEK